jgi:hypothetical protein
MKKYSLSILPLFVFFAAPLYQRLAERSAPGATRVAHAARLQADRERAKAVRARIEAARKLLERQPDPAPDTVTVAAEETGDSRLVLSSLGEPLHVTVVRPNYVNTALRVADGKGRELAPLAVKYPRTEGNRVKEIAYYTSAHPAIASPELTRDGRDYVTRSLAEATAALAARGVKISPATVEMARRLCFVEHADHKRFMTEDHGALFDEIATLYSVNAGDTYRYSVSSAGAGGMIQMIPQTYAAIRAQNPQVGLKADFVSGMQDHSNALQAMLLYIQSTWDDLARRDQIKQALATGLATQQELLAAGYNSNPYRLASYIERGGSNWRALIPAETQMYLRIHAAVEQLVPAATGDDAAAAE